MCTGKTQTHLHTRAWGGDEECGKDRNYTSSNQDPRQPGPLHQTSIPRSNNLSLFLRLCVYKVQMVLIINSLPLCFQKMLTFRAARRTAGLVWARHLSSLSVSLSVTHCHLLSVSATH